ncbi:MAG: hypothetical protein M1829_006895, partial [Trizodia sp. TS-e1964]
MIHEFSRSPAGAGFKPNDGHMPCLAHVIQLSLGKLVDGIKISATNDKIIKNWDEGCLRKLQGLSGMALTLEKLQSLAVYVNASPQRRQDFYDIQTES